jgi:hypothetical protein
MIRKVLLTGVTLAAAYLVVTALPDIARYIKMKQM